MAVFDFGKNWEDFSLNALDQSSLKEAEESLESLLGREGLRGKSFLDIGSGTGIFSIAAAKMDASKIVGFDINQKCIEIAVKNSEVFALGSVTPEFRRISILESDSIAALGKYDVVYAWGSLHHTGAMFKAIENASGCVANGGTFVLAIYNKHVTSPIWKKIKRFYNQSPGVVRRLMVYLFILVIFTAKLLFTRRNPFKQRRGMNFYYDVIDWIGGYPYEYASADEIVKFLNCLNFKNVKVTTPDVPTGCNEFVFVKQQS